MMFYNETRPLYLKTSASQVEVGGGLIQVREGMNCLQDTEPDNILRSVEFTSTTALPGR